MNINTGNVGPHAPVASLLPIADTHSTTNKLFFSFFGKALVPALQTVLSIGLTTQGHSVEKDAGEKRILEKQAKCHVLLSTKKQLVNEKHFNSDGCARHVSKTSAVEKVSSQLGKSRFKAGGNVKRSMCIYYSQAESAEPTRQWRAE